MAIDVSAAERISGWMSTAELEWLAEAASRSRCIIEIGCLKGRSTKALATHTEGIVYAIDHWRFGVHDRPEATGGTASRDADAVYAEFVRNLQPELSAGKVVAVRAGSEHAMPLLRELLTDSRADMVFIDGDHSYGAVKRDIQNYRSLLRDGGLLAGHDYAPAWPGVVAAVDELVPSRTVAAGSIWSWVVDTREKSATRRPTLPLMDFEQLAISRLQSQADDLRRRGRLIEAREAFERLCRSTPADVKAQRLFASLAGRPPPVGPLRRGFDPAPFVRIPGFLPADVHDRLWEALIESADRFVTADVGRPDDRGGERREVDRAYRRSAALRRCFDHLAPELGTQFHRRLADQFRSITTRLGVRLTACRPGGVRALLYLDGDFFRPHSDCTGHDTRQITFLYYLHTLPKAFSGGDFILYDTRTGADALEQPAYRPSTFTRIPCADNELVCFPSAYFHEALTVSGTGGDVRRARMAITGWLHG